jgi:dihydrofolate reductase
VEGNARLATAPVADEIVPLREGSDGFLSVGGAGLASTLVEQDLIDEYRLFVNPVVLGGGTPYFPEGRDRLDLELAETHTFDSRVVYLRYRRTRSESAGERNGSR